MKTVKLRQLIMVFLFVFLCVSGLGTVSAAAGYQLTVDQSSQRNYCTAVHDQRNQVYLLGDDNLIMFFEIQNE